MPILWVTPRGPQHAIEMTETAETNPPGASLQVRAATGRLTAMLPMFVATIFLGAVLVFGVQPIVARLLLPQFGGSPAVWSASTVFFQLALLAGYAYSYVITRFVSPRYQPLVHLPILVLPILMLPLNLPLSDS